MIIVLIGLPGSGKGTQGQLLAEKIKLPLISTGDMFRKMLQSNGEEGALLNDFISQGKLVPSKLVNKVVEKFLGQQEYKNGCIIDGYPRNLEQVKFLEEITKQDIKVIYFEISEGLIRKRILGRFSCVGCGKIYNSYYTRPKVENVCDICKSTNFTYRKDDDEQTLIKRINEYKTETYPIIDYYKKRGGCYVIDASKTTGEISAELESLFR